MTDLPPELEAKMGLAIDSMAGEHVLRAVDSKLAEIAGGPSLAAQAARESLGRIAVYAERRFRASVLDMLDDPSFLLHPDEDAPAYLAAMRQLARDFGYELAVLIASLDATEFERERLRKIIADIDRPSP